MSGAAFTPSRAQAFGTWEPGSRQSSAHLGAHLDRVYLSLSCRHCCPGSEQPGRSRVSEGLLRKYPLLCRKKLWSQRSPGIELSRTGLEHTLSASSLTTGQDGCVSDKLICSFQGVFLMNLSVFTDH